jgi:hypothetical protein
MKMASILALFLGWQVAFAGSTAALRASDVLTDIERRGARAVVQKLCEDEPRWQELLKVVSSGASEWVAVATRLRQGSDAACSETLEIAIFFALGNAPTETLKLLSKDRFSVLGVCSSNFLTDTVADQNALSLIDKRIAALEIVKDPDLVTTRNLCIKGLEQARLDVLRIMAETGEKSESK